MTDRHTLMLQMEAQLYDINRQWVSDNRHIFEGRVVYDVGANAGVFTSLIHEYAPTHGEIHLFEPCAELHARSKERLSGIPNIKFNNFGLGSVNETLTLYRPKSGPSGWNTFGTVDPLQPTGFFNDMDRETCEVRRLDDYNGPPPGVIKIDVEGHEAHVIEGAFETIRKHKPLLYVEVGWGTSHPNWQTHNSRIYDQLFGMGYAHVNIGAGTQDILFTPL